MDVCASGHAGGGDLVCERGKRVLKFRRRGIEHGQVSAQRLRHEPAENRRDAIEIGARAELRRSGAEAGGEDRDEQLLELRRGLGTDGGRAVARDGSIEAVTTGPVGMPLGGARSGLRVFLVNGATLTHRYFEFGELPTTLDRPEGLRSVTKRPGVAVR